MDFTSVKIIKGTDGSALSDFAPDLSLFNRFDFNKEYTVFPGFCDVHVHLREPGFSYKETVRTGSLAGARGGYTALCAMPNLNPVPDCLTALDIQREIIKRDAVISVYPYGSITKGERGEELSDMQALAPFVVAFSDDGRGVQNEDIIKRAMEKARILNKPIVAHCEANELLCGGYIHDGKYAETHGHIGISSESEYIQVERDLRLAEETGAIYHVCHISTKESADLIRKAKKRGVNVSCETAPHYLILDENDIEEDGKWKMNPPLRSKEDRLALVQAVKDGTIDMIATDHAPHSAEEKSKGLKGSAFGIVGLETAFSALYTALVKTGEITLEKLIDLMAINPRKRFNLPFDGFSVWDLEKKTVINPDNFLSKGRATPFAGRTVYGINYLTVKGGKTVYERPQSAD